MYRRAAIIFSLGSLAAAAFAQDASGGWRKFGTSSADQAEVAQNSQTRPINQAQVNEAQAPASVPVPSEITLPAGTFVRARVNEELSSDKNQAGDLFTATLLQPLVANGLVIAQPGQDIAGRVSEAVKAKDNHGTSRLGLELTELSLVDGQQVPIRTQLMEYRRPNNNGRDAGVVVGTTAAGAAIGAIAGGGFGAGVGALGGAVAGAIGVVATHAHATEIHPEAVLTFRTIDSVSIATDRSGGAFQPVQQQDYRSQLQPRQRAVAPPADYGYYGGYYPYYGPYYSPYYYPYGYGLGFGYFGPSVVIRGGRSFRGGGGFRGGHGGGHGGGRR
jgi:outer membrane lipoprotein SlyB